MAKYKKVNENIIDKFINKVFGTVAKGLYSARLKDLAKKDPKFKKEYDTLQMLQKKMEKRYKTDKEFEDRLQQILKK